MKANRTCTALMLASAAALGITGAAQAAGLLVADGGLGGQLEIQQHDVKVTINNGVAVTEVTQVFQNLENRQVEALYTFPVPRGGSVSNFSMWINGKEMVGEVLEKQKAREIYNSYKQVKRDPGLLEQTDYRTFEMRVFPIGPKAQQKVQVTYCQQLDVDNDIVTYVYPLATSTRKDIQPRVAGGFSMNISTLSEVPIVQMDSPSHAKQFAIAKHQESAYEASLEAKTGDLSRDVVVSYKLSRPKTGMDLITSRQGGGDGYFLLTLTAGEELGQAKNGMDYVFVQDVSGSMADDGKLDVSRNAVGAFVSSLSPEDKFELIAFDLQTQQAFGKIQPASDAAKQQAMTFLQSEQAKGGTRLQSAVEAAYRYAEPGRPLNVVILSDGLTEQNHVDVVDLIKQRPAGSRVFCVGVGNDVNRRLLEQLADDSGGLAAFVSREDNLQRAAEGFRRKLLRPVASDVKMSFSGVDVYDLEPGKLPALYHGSPVRVYGRYKGSGTATVTVDAMVGEQPIHQQVQMEFPKQDDANPEIERMWAWHKVQGLLKQADADGKTPAVMGEIVRLGEGYSIATEYTSFLVLENDAEFQRWKIDRKNALRTERDRASLTQRQAKFAAMRNKAAAAIGPEAVQLASAQPAAGAPANTVVPTAGQPAAQSPAATPAAQPMRNTGHNVDFTVPHGGGGGALDPMSVAIIGAAALLAVRRGRRKQA